MLTPLKNLEQKLELLIAAVKQTRNENLALRQDNYTLHVQNQQLLERMSQAQDALTCCCIHSNNALMRHLQKGTIDEYCCEKETLNVSILGRSYTLLCSPDEKASLLASVALVDQKMQTINQQMGLSGHDKIAVFAALQIAHELLQHNLHNHTNIEKRYSASMP